MENTVDKNAEALEQVSEALFNLFFQDDAENLKKDLWWMFRQSLLSDGQDPDLIADSVVLYEVFEELISALGKIEHKPFYSFKITYEPSNSSQS